MSSNKVGGPGDPSRIPAPADAAAATAAAQLRDAQTQAQNLAAHGSHRGASFTHAHHHHPAMHRGPTPRMPLRSPKSKPKTSKGKKSKRGAASAEEHEIEHEPETHISEEQMRLQLLVQLRSQDEGGNSGDSEEGDRDEKRFDKIQAANSSSTSGWDALRQSARLHFMRNAAPTPLPPMQSLRDLVEYIHQTINNPVLVPNLMRTLKDTNSAILSGKINVPKPARVADVRPLLIDTFGSTPKKTDANKAALDPRSQNFHLLLPLWLINLGRQRTLVEQSQAASRLMMPRNQIKSS